MACLAISSASLCWVTLADGTLSVGAAVFLVILPWVLLRVGRAFTHLIGFPSFFSFDFLLGFILVSMGFVVWKLVVPVSLWALLAILALAAGILSASKQSNSEARMSGAEFLALAISVAAATGWSQDLLAPTRATPDFVIFKPWSDFFFHATIVTRSLDAKTLPQAGSFEWHGLPALVYHYGSYSLPVLLVKVSKITSYASVVGFWTPFGSFISGLAAFALGRLFWNDVAGLAAMAGVMLIPDPGLLHIGHPYYAYFWLQHIDPGGLYGVTVAGTALGLVALGVRQRPKIVDTVGRRRCFTNRIFQSSYSGGGIPNYLLSRRNRMAASPAKTMDLAWPMCSGRCRVRPANESLSRWTRRCLRFFR